MRFLGPDHDNTLIAQSELALAYSRAGLIDKAIELNEVVLKNRERLVGPDDPNTLESKMRPGQLYFVQERWEESRDIYKAVMITKEKLFGESATATLFSASDFACALTRLGQTEEAAALHENIFSELKKRLGDENEKTIKVMSDLAVTYQFQRAWDKAEGLEIQVLEYRRRHPTIVKINLLTALRNLSDSLYNQEKWTRCAELSIKELNLRQSLSKSPGEPDEGKILAVTKAARALAFTKQWDSAIPLLDQEISWRQNSKIDTVPDIMEALALCASANIHLGRPKMAKTRIADFLEASLGLQGANSSHARMIHDLAESCEQETWLAEAEQLFVLELLMRKQVCADDLEGMKKAVEGAQRVLERQGKGMGSVTFDPGEIIRNAREGNT